MDALEGGNMVRDTLPLKVAVKPLDRECDRCILIGSRLCVLCSTLVEDSEGLRYVALRPIEGDRWRKVDMADLSGAPEVLRRQS